MQQGEVVGTIVAGCVVALFVAGIAWFGTERIAHQRELMRARHDRDLAAAEAFYLVYGQFFAVWKAWEFARGRRPGDTNVVAPEVRRQLLAEAAECEGNYESLIVRVALEHHLEWPDRAALWAMRNGLKELRRAIRNDVPLGWWRTDDPSDADRHAGSQKYAAFKLLASRVARIMIDADPRIPSPGPTESADALSEITATMSPPGGTSGAPFRGSRWAEAVSSPSR